MLALEPRVDAEAEGRVIMEVPEVVMVVAWIREQVDRQQVQVDAQKWGEDEPGPNGHGRREVDRREEDAAVSHIVVPVPGTQDVTPRRPSEVRRHPDPALGGR